MRYASELAQPERGDPQLLRSPGDSQWRRIDEVRTGAQNPRVGDARRTSSWAWP